MTWTVITVVALVIVVAGVIALASYGQIIGSGNPSKVGTLFIGQYDAFGDLPNASVLDVGTIAWVRGLSLFYQVNSSSAWVSLQIGVDPDTQYVLQSQNEGSLPNASEYTDGSLIWTKDEGQLWQADTGVWVRIKYLTQYATSADLPAASSVSNGHVAWVLDESLFYESDTSTWSEVVMGGTGLTESEVFDLFDGVDGGAGFANSVATMVLNLGNSRNFHTTMVGNITSLSFSNVPSPTTLSPVWTWVLQIDGTGGYTLAGTPTVTWTGGSDWDDIDFTADAVNIMTFWRIGSVTYANLVTNGTTSLDPYTLSYSGNGSKLVVIDRDMTLDLGSVIHRDAAGNAGTASLAYEKNGVAASGSTSFVANNVLKVTVSSYSTDGSIAIPRSV